MRIILIKAIFTATLMAAISSYAVDISRNANTRLNQNTQQQHRPVTPPPVREKASSRQRKSTKYVFEKKPSIEEIEKALSEDPFANIQLKEADFDGLFHHLSLSISETGLAKLKNKRTEAFKKGILSSNDEDYVNARLKLDDQPKLKIKLRLKGDFVEHLEGYKWSFRIKTKGDGTIFGMKTFSIHHPKARTYVREWLFHEILRQEDIIALRYHFVKVSLNGQYLGLYALEEHFDKRLVENNERREGPIIKLNEDAFWENYLNRINKTDRKLYKDIELYQTAKISAFRMNSITKKPQQLRYFEKARSLLDGFRHHRLSVSMVFDVEKMARYYALSYLVGQTHGLRWNNLRFYYNPISSRLEPIGFDAEPNLGWTAYNGFIKNSKLFGIFSESLFNDEIFLKLFISELRRVSSKQYLDDIVGRNNHTVNRYFNALKQEFILYRHTFSGIRKNHHDIQDALKIDAKVAAYIKQQVPTDDGSVKLHLGIINNGKLPVYTYYVKTDHSRETYFAKQLIMPTTRYSQHHFYEAVFEVPEKVVSPLTLAYRLPGEWQEYLVPVDLSDNLYKSYKSRKNTWYKTPIKTKDREVEESLMDLSRASMTDISLLEFLEVNEKDRVIHIKPGLWKIYQNILLPKGYMVKAGPGTHLELYENSNIISYSPVMLIGTAESPIRIESKDGSAQSFTVFNAKQPSALQYVNFRGLGYLNHNAWEMTGAVVFYQSPVKISYCEFRGNRSEDGLNIIRSTYEMDNVLVSNSASDGFDADFSDGSIRHSRFINCGNDCIDVSGSELTVNDVILRVVGDKGISVGENSRATLANVSILEGNIGIASKDHSIVRGDRIRLKKLTIGLTAYQKKPEFGPSKLFFQNLDQQDVDIKYLIEEGGELEVDHQAVQLLAKNKTNLIVRQIKEGGKLN